MIIHNQPFEMQKAELPRFAHPPPLIYIWFLAIFAPFSALARSVVVRWPFGRAPPLVSGPPLGGRRASSVLLACPPFCGSFIVPLPPPVVRAKRSSHNTENPPCGSHICASPCGAVRFTLAHYKVNTIMKKSGGLRPLIFVIVLVLHHSQIAPCSEAPAKLPRGLNRGGS